MNLCRKHQPFHSKSSGTTSINIVFENRRFGCIRDVKTFLHDSFDLTKCIMLINWRSLNSASRSQSVVWKGYLVVNVSLWREPWEIDWSHWNRVIVIMPSRTTEKQISSLRFGTKSRNLNQVREKAFSIILPVNLARPLFVDGRIHSYRDMKAPSSRWLAGRKKTCVCKYPESFYSEQSAGSKE
jgi:hypothetical protein